MEWTASDVEDLEFITAGSAYYFVTSDGRRMDVAKVRSIQPEIQDHDRYPSYLWVEAVQGYYVLRQWFMGGRPGGWRLIRELEQVEETFGFFDTQGDLLEEEFNATPCSPPE